MAVRTITVTQTADKFSYTTTVSPTSISYNPGDTLSVVTSGATFNGTTGVILYWPDGLLASSGVLGLGIGDQDSATIVTQTTTNFGSFQGVAGTATIRIQTYQGTPGLTQGLANCTITGTGDSTPNTFGFTDVTSAAFGTDYERSIIITGLGTGNKCIIFCDGATFKINSGAYQESNRYALASNSDTVTVKLRSGIGHDISAQAVLYASTLTRTSVVKDTLSVTTSSPSGSTYGVEVYNSSGNKTLAIDSYQSRYVQQGTVTLDMSNSAGTPQVITDTAVVSVPGMTNTDTWQILYTSGFFTVGDTEADLTVTKQTNQFTVSRTETVPANTSDTSLNDVSYIVYNIG